jgi:hypothetical protein
MKRPTAHRPSQSGDAAHVTGRVQGPADIFCDPIFACTHQYVDAVPHDSVLELPEYANNALILALPPFVDLEGTLDALRRHFAVSYPDGCRTWSKERRLMAIGRIERLLIILPVHFTLLTWIHTALRNHYQRYRPGIDYHLIMQESYEKVQKGEPGVIADLVEGHAACRALVGMSGTGKSTAMRLMLSLFSPVIRHKDVRNPECRFRQLVWIYITCPANGSVMTFLKDILKWVDYHLDTHHLEEMRARDTSGDYVAKIIVVLRTHFTGLLVIDEFQNLLRAAASTELLDTVVNLLNSGCACMMVMGTPEIERVVRTRLRLARRASNDGYEILEPLRAGEVYETFVNEVLALNYLTKPVHNPRRVKAAILELSAGLPALIKLLPRLAQYMAIETGGEQITPKLLTQVRDELLGPLSGILKALLEKDSTALASCVDVLCGAVDQAHRDAMNQAIGTGSENIHEQMRNQIFASAVSSLLALGATQSDADQWVSQVLRKKPGLTAHGVVLEVLRRVERSQSPTAPPKSI